MTSPARRPGRGDHRRVPERRRRRVGERLTPGRRRDRARAAGPHPGHGETRPGELRRTVTGPAGNAWFRAPGRPVSRASTPRGRLTWLARLRLLVGVLTRHRARMAACGARLRARSGPPEPDRAPRSCTSRPATSRQRRSTSPGCHFGHVTAVSEMVAASDGRCGSPTCCAGASALARTPRDAVARSRRHPAVPRRRQGGRHLVHVLRQADRRTRRRGRARQLHRAQQPERVADVSVAPDGMRVVRARSLQARARDGGRCRDPSRPDPGDAAGVRRGGGALAREPVGGSCTDDRPLSGDGDDEAPGGRTGTPAGHRSARPRCAADRRALASASRRRSARRLVFDGQQLSRAGTLALPRRVNAGRLRRWSASSPPAAASFSYMLGAAATATATRRHADGAMRVTR